MSLHKYACGQQVSFTDLRILAPGPISTFTVSRLLPLGDEPPRYEVQGTHETFRRVAREADLEPSKPAVPDVR